MNDFAIPKIERAIREISPLSESARALVSLTSGCDHENLDIVRVVERDASLTVRILRIANSSFVAPISTIESLGHAISLMGEDAVVAAAVAVGSNWMQTPFPSYGAEVKVSDHVVETAVCASLIAKHLKWHDLAARAYTAGLLHDIGAVILSQVSGPANPHVWVVARSSDGAEDQLAFERSEFGIDHCQIGGMVADHFGLGDGLRVAIEHHHDPSAAPTEHRQLAQVVYLADATGTTVERTASEDSNFCSADSSVLHDLGLFEAELSGITLEAGRISRSFLDAAFAD